MKKQSKSVQVMTPIFEKIGMLSKLQRSLICCASFLILIGAFYYFSYMPKIEKINGLTQRRDTLRQQVATAQQKAKQLAKYREEKKKAEADFMIARKVLPEKTEIPSLLTGISRSGQNAGLEFLLFQPQKEIRKDFYAEIPVSVKVVGGFHNVAAFFDNVARLDRIVTVQNVAMEADKAGKDKLTTSCTAVTYRFVEPEIKPSAEPQKGKRRRR
ncbi:MAG: type 4a pilus biogenesis protein PilO [Desulfobacterales bacterium]|jgi:type IV pilus assembly protein PilO|nr:type 4a pilus biogenesis protein PilO [Desulfobacterales bacterium]